MTRKWIIGIATAFLSTQMTLAASSALNDEFQSSSARDPLQRFLHSLPLPTNHQKNDLQALLDRKSDFSFRKLSLREFFTFMREKSRINLRMEPADLPLDIVSRDSRITLTAKDVSVRTILTLGLFKSDLTFVVEDDGIAVMPKKNVRHELVTRVYPVPDLVVTSEKGELRLEEDDVISALMAAADTSVWTDGNGSEQIVYCLPCSAIVIRQTPQIHEVLERTLAALRFCRTHAGTLAADLPATTLQTPIPKIPARSLSKLEHQAFADFANLKNTEGMSSLKASLTRPIRWANKNRTLQELSQELFQKVGLRMLVDPRIQGMPCPRAEDRELNAELLLKQICLERKLTIGIHGQMLIVYSKYARAKNYVDGIYSLAELCTNSNDPEENASLIVQTIKDVFESDSDDELTAESLSRIRIAGFAKEKLLWVHAPLRIQAEIAMTIECLKESAFRSATVLSLIQNRGHQPFPGTLSVNRVSELVAELRDRITAEREIADKIRNESRTVSDNSGSALSQAIIDCQAAKWSSQRAKDLTEELTREVERLRRDIAKVQIKAAR